mgnify:CR=1 FL=1
MKSLILFFSLALTQFSFAQMPTESISEIGLTIEATQNSTFVIRDVQPASPAFKAGLKANDMITSVKKDSNSEPVQTAKKSLEQVASLLKGPKGSSLTLQFLRHPAKDFKQVTLIRNQTSEKK